MVLPSHVHRNSKEPLIVAAAKAASPQAARVLIARGAAVSAADESGTTALMIVARTPRVDFARQLLDAGARVDQEDRVGRTAIWHAATLRQSRDGEAARRVVALPSSTPTRVA